MKIFKIIFIILIISMNIMKSKQEDFILNSSITTQSPLTTQTATTKFIKQTKEIIENINFYNQKSTRKTTTTTMDDLILSRPNNFQTTKIKNSKKLLDFHTNNNKKDDKEKEEEEDNYYDKSESEDSDYHDDDDDYNENSDLTFSNFGNKKFLDDGSSDDSMPIFLEEPKSTFVIRNKPAQLDCKAIHALDLIFKCSGNVQPKLINHDSHVDPHTGIRFLEITTEINRNIVDEYFGSGPFQCECYAKFPRGSIKSQPAIIEVAYIRKQFSESPTSVRAEIGTRAEMHCSPPIAIPSVNVTWLKNGISLISSQTVTILDDHGLIFPHVTIQDMGNYSCVAENIAGRRVSDVAILNIYADGGWSSWSQWIDCKCYGKQNNGQKRTRACTNPAPSNGGAPCVGSTVQKSPDCVICQSGRWSNWSEWSMCGFDCIQSRRRSCLSTETHYESYDDEDATAERYVCVGRDFQSAECRGGSCHIDRDETDWPMYAGLVVIMIVCIVFGGFIYYGTKRRQKLSPYTSTRTDLVNSTNYDHKPIGYSIVPSQTIVSTNYSYPFSRNSTGTKQNLLHLHRPLSEHLYDEPTLTQNHFNPTNQLIEDKVSIDDSFTSSHYSRNFYSSDTNGGNSSSHNT